MTQANFNKSRTMIIMVHALHACKLYVSVSISAQLMSVMHHREEINRKKNKYKFSFSEYDAP